MFTYLDFFHTHAYDIQPLNYPKRLRVMEGQLYETVVDAQDDWSWAWYCSEKVKLWAKMTSL